MSHSCQQSQPSFQNARHKYRLFASDYIISLCMVCLTVYAHLHAGQKHSQLARGGGAGVHLLGRSGRQDSAVAAERLPHRGPGVRAGYRTDLPQGVPGVIVEDAPRRRSVSTRRAVHAYIVHRPLCISAFRLCVCMYGIEPVRWLAACGTSLE